MESLGQQIDLLEVPVPNSSKVIHLGEKQSVCGISVKPCLLAIEGCSDGDDDGKYNSHEIISGDCVPYSFPNLCVVDIERWCNDAA